MQEPDFDQIIANLSAEFEIDARDKLADIRALLRNQQEIRQAIPEIRQVAHNLKGMGGSFGYPAITVISHRLEDFIADDTEISDYDIGQCEIFIDRMEDVLDGKLPADSDEIPGMVRSLPSRSGSEPDSARSEAVAEILLVTQNNTAAQLMRQRIKACGCRVVVIPSGYAALEMAVRAQPDVVISCRFTDNLDGLDLIRALRAMASTRSIPVALVTSVDVDELKDELPGGVPLIRRGDDFQSDVANVLELFGLTDSLID